ncbi:hypothetical protein [Peribacillus asahii]|uniref:hypothetical protein n=1 Tax=Peribacillus asahii TaxID=228899 RepID=UPI00381F335D
MYIVASFEYSTHLEMAITEIERIGISKEKIATIPLDKRVEKARLFDSIHRSDGISLVDLAAILGTTFMLFGVIYGYKLKIGPIFAALCGLVFGLIFGFAIDYLTTKNKKKKKAGKEKQTEIFLMINCAEDKVERIQDILWEHFAFGIGKINK